LTLYRRDSGYPSRKWRGILSLSLALALSILAPTVCCVRLEAEGNCIVARAEDIVVTDPINPTDTVYGVPLALAEKFLARVRGFFFFF
jgi:hypothetical protein